MPERSTSLWRYVARGREHVPGWLARCDAEIIATLLDAQRAAGIHGAVCEVGIHHGKSFIALALGNGGERCYAIDIFDDQQHNKDGSGLGDLAAFTRNLSRFGLDAGRITVDKRPSETVSAKNIIDAVGEVRLFSVDGGHHETAVMSDLRLARACRCERGVIALDDPFRGEWPEVGAAYEAWRTADRPDLVPFATGFNKTYLCRPAEAEKYRSALASNDFLQIYYNKTYPGRDGDVDVYHELWLPEWRLRKRAYEYLKLYHPALAHLVYRVAVKLG